MDVMRVTARSSWGSLYGRDGRKNLRAIFVDCSYVPVLAAPLEARTPIAGRRSGTRTVHQTASAGHSKSFHAARMTTSKTANIPEQPSKPTDAPPALCTDAST